MRNASKFIIPAFFLPIIITIFIFGCSKGISSYDELEKAGKIESVSRKTYKSFFTALKKLSSSSEISDKDTLLIKTAQNLTKNILNDASEFPSTVKSRIAVDAISFACKEITESKVFGDSKIFAFWQDSLLTPLYLTGENFIKKGNVNESAHLQIVKAIRRAIGGRANDETVLSIMPIIGVSPSQELMEYCNSDSLVLKKIHDLIIYSRSLQKTDPPVWMLSGAWFADINFAGMPPIFISFVPNIIDGMPYLSFKDYNLGDIYAQVFNDPVPESENEWNNWLDRADKTIKNLKIDNEFAEKVLKSDLPIYDAHNFFGNFLIHTDIDTLKKEFLLTISKGKSNTPDMNVVGSDSIAFVFPERLIIKPDSLITMINVTRVTGSSVVQGQFIPSSRIEGKAYFMRLGEHNNELISKYREINSKNNFKVDVKVN